MGWLLILGAFTDAAGPSASSTTTNASVRLTAIKARPHGKGALLVIEATEPVPYVASRPDPLTVCVDFRNVSAAQGLASGVVSSTASGLIAGVAVEASQSLGAPATRVRVALAQPVAHHVRSERNTVVIEFDKPSASGALYLVPRVTEISGVDPIDALGLSKPSASSDGELAPPAVMMAQVPSPAAPMRTTLPVPLQQTASARQAASAPAQQAPAPAPKSAPTQATTPGQTPAPQTPAQTSAPQTPASSGTEQIGAPRSERKFTGHPISLDFQGADLRAVLRTFAEISGLNIVIDPAVQGTVDVALRDVPWDQALDIILRANKLGYIVDGTIVRIAPLSVLADEEGQKRKLADEQALAGELRVLTKRLSYARAEDLQALLTKSALSQRGTVQIDPRTNTLIITDLADRLQTANELISTLDKPQPQVEIEARIVQTNKNYARQLGIQWGFLGQATPALGNTTNLAFPNSVSLSGQGLGAQAPAANASAAVPTAVNLPAPNATSAVGLQLGSINGAFNLDMALSAMESTGNGRLLSTPRVSTQNNIEAEITQGQQIPIQTVANNTVTVTFKDAALTLKVTPQITSAGTVIMKIALENGSPDFSRAINGIPPINTQRANTTVLVTDGQTTVIGGIYVSQEQNTEDRTPGLGRIPLLKWLFKRDLVNDQSTELLIFITPRILKT